MGGVLSVGIETDPNMGLLGQQVALAFQLNSGWPQQVQVTATASPVQTQHGEDRAGILVRRWKVLDAWVLGGRSGVFIIQILAHI